MRLTTYTKTAALGFFQVANYRTEIWFQVFQRLLVLAGIVLLWSVIGTGATGQTYSQLIAYFLVANGVRELIDAQYGKFGSLMIDDVKDGKINALLLQPTNTVVFMFFKHLGTRGVSIVFSLFFVIIGVVMAPPTSVLTGLLFLVVVAAATVTSMAQSTMVGSGAFWMTEAKGIKNVVNHVTRILSGSYMPLTFFPAAIQVPALLSPFASYAYLPAALLQTKTVDAFVLLQVGAAIFWAVMMQFLSRWIWKRGIKQYEAIGI